MSQLSSVVASPRLTVAPQVSSSSAVTLAGQVMVGGVVSSTTTSTVHSSVAVLASSLAVKVTVVVPVGNPPAGPRFDPLAYRQNQDQPEYAIGGRGLALVISFADEIAYQRKADRNVTTFIVSKHGSD